jgi:hypothetical protein
MIFLYFSHLHSDHQSIKYCISFICGTDKLRPTISGTFRQFHDTDSVTILQRNVLSARMHVIAWQLSVLLAILNYLSVENWFVLVVRKLLIVNPFGMKTSTVLDV